MLQATYKDDDTYVFYISTEDRRYDTTTDITTGLIQYLFKFTNNMDGSVVYAYAQSIERFDRYTRCSFYHDTAEDVYTGKVNFVPNGYYNYKVYELTSATAQTLSCSTAPATANGDTPSGVDTGNIGQYTITDGDGVVTSTVKLTGQNDVYDLPLTNADAGASNWNIKVYNDCSDTVPILTSGFYFPTITAQADDTRWVEITKVQQTATGISGEIVSNMPIGYSWEFSNSVTGAVISFVDVTAKPETKSFTLPQIDPPSSVPISLLGYDEVGGSAGGGGYAWSSVPLTLVPVKNPSTYYGFGEALAVNPVSESIAGAELSKGNAWLTIIAGSTAESTTQGFYTLQGVVEQGKLYVSEPSGEEQVQYTENPTPTGSNYVWYGE
jgi:hypothetical protein